MTLPILIVILLGACASAAYGAATLPGKVRALEAALAPMPSAEDQVIALAKAEIAATKRSDLLAAARFAEQQETAHG